MRTTPPCGRYPHTTILLAIATLALPATAAPPEEPPPRVIVFGGDADYPPFEWREDDVARGFNIHLEQAIAAAGDREYRHRLGDWPEMVSALENGAIDVLPMFRTPRRERRFLFSDPIHFAETTAFAPASAPNIRHILDLVGKRVAIERSSHAHTRLPSEVPGIELVETRDTLAAVRAVAEGRAEYAVLSTLVAQQLIRTHGLALKRKGPPLWSHAYAFAVHRDRRELAQWVDDSLDRVIATGEFGRIRARWEDRLDPTPPNWRDLIETAGLVGGPLLLLAGLVLVWNRTLRRRVATRTTELSAELARRREAEAAVRHYSQHEMTTGLPRRSHFLDLANTALNGAGPQRRIHVIVVHFLNLGEITRLFGHRTGEAALRIFADRLRTCEVEALGHFGGRTFGAVAAVDPIDRVIGTLSDPLVIESIEFDPVIVAGVATAPDHGTSASELLRRAETALADVTGTRSTHVVYDPSMEPDPRDLQLVRDFRQGDGAGMYALFQPQIDLSTRACVGCETLVRWDHAELGMISPGHFVPLLERTGLIAALTPRMLDHALGFAARLRAAGLVCPVSVNVSVHDLLESDLPGELERALERHGARPGDIKIELTETSFSTNKEAMNRSLQRIRALGIRSSIDDFGTGYASLSYLSQFAVDEVKIDRSFVDKMQTNHRHRAIVNASIVMAHDMGMTVTAEGIEDVATLDTLHRKGCDQAQGYAIAHPLNPDDMLAFAQHTVVPPLA